MRGQGAWNDLVPADDMSRREAKRVIRRLWRMLGPWHRGIVYASAVVVVQVAALVAGPSLVRYGIDAGIQVDDKGALNLAVVMYIGVALLSLVLGRAVTRMVARLGESFLQWLRTHVFRHLMSLSMDFFEKEKTGRLVARMTSDIDALQELISQGLVLMVQNVLLFVGTAVVITVISPLLALVTLAIVPPVYFASRWFRRVSNVAYLEVRDRISTNMSTLQESLEGIRVVQAFAREKHASDRFSETNEAQFEANLSTVSISAKYFPAVEMSGVVGTAVIIGVGGWMVHAEAATIGTVAAFVLYLNNLFEPIQQLSQFYNTVQSGGAALNKLFGLLDTGPSVSERPGAFDIAPSAVDIVVNCVSFAYLDDVVLDNVSMTIHAGERVALVGPTGAGKSTLAKLLARFYDPSSGSVSIGGADLRAITLDSLRRRMCFVPQEGYLFAGTLRENVRIGRPEASDVEVEDAMRALGVLEHFAAFPGGLDTEVREGDSRLSAGERQLMSLARAALADPAILILDEATSNLDPGTEQSVEQALEALMHGRTVVVVAHRLSTAERADRVAVIDGGRLVEYGTHADLVGAGGRYASLFAAWVVHRP